MKSQKLGIKVSNEEELNRFREEGESARISDTGDRKNPTQRRGASICTA